MERRAGREGAGGEAPGGGGGEAPTERGKGGCREVCFKRLARGLIFRFVLV